MGYPGKNKGIASLILGIVALVFTWFSIYAQSIAIILSIVGIVLAISAKKESQAAGAPSGMATGGLVCSIIALSLSSIMFIACSACVACTACAAFSL